MKKLRFFILIGCVLSCSINKDIFTQSSAYELIIKDIKEDSRFIEFKDQYQNSCEGFSVYSESFSICDFEIIQFIEIESKDLQDIYKEFCMNESSNKFFNPIEKDLNKFSDKADQCFYVWFSEEINKKIIVQIIDMESYDQFGYEVLHYIYEVKDEKVEKSDTFGAIVN